MRFVDSRVVLAIAVVLGACAQTTSRDLESGSAQSADAPPQIEPKEERPGPAQASNDLVVLLPKASGAVGAVVVRSGGSDAVVLDKPYAAAHIKAAGRVQPLTYNADLAKKEFSATLAALPVRPATFLVFFLKGKDEFTPDSEREVGRIFAEIAARPDPEILIIGHTDAVGSMQYNDQLSLQRAHRVREDLSHRGIPLKYIEVAGRGNREPVVRTAADAPEPMNRRVEIIVR
jgi:outer membrane protein OmpA-like peptidoglycan-associated protein